MPSSSQASARTSSEPSMSAGDSWWSTSAVVPWSSASATYEARRGAQRRRRRARGRAATRRARGSRGSCAAARAGRRHAERRQPAVEVRVRVDQRRRRSRCQSPGAARMRPTLIARAAGESFIGSVMRRMPSNASSAPATAAAVGTRPISPTPLAPNGPSGSGSSTRMTSTSGMSRARSTPSSRSLKVTGMPSSQGSSSVSA